MSDENNFTYLWPLPESHPRTLSIHGQIPGHSYSHYNEFNKFLWALLALERSSPETPITLVIDSPGGDASSLNMLLDHINLISSPVYTIARNANSAAGLLFASGAKGHRYMFEHSKIILHNGSLLHDDECPGHGWWIFKKYCEATASQKELDKIIEQFGRMLDKWTDGKLLESEETDEEKRVEAMIRLLDESPVFDSQKAVRCGLTDHIIGEEEFQSLFLS